MYVIAAASLLVVTADSMQEEMKGCVTHRITLILKTITMLEGIDQITRFNIINSSTCST